MEMAAKNLPGIGIVLAKLIFKGKVLLYFQDRLKLLGTLIKLQSILFLVIFWYRRADSFDFIHQLQVISEFPGTGICRLLKPITRQKKF